MCAKAKAVETLERIHNAAVENTRVWVREREIDGESNEGERECAWSKCNNVA